jgi:hypothetical protein
MMAAAAAAALLMAFQNGTRHLVKYQQIVEQSLDGAWVRPSLLAAILLETEGRSIVVRSSFTNSEENGIFGTFEANNYLCLMH